MNAQKTNRCSLPSANFPILRTRLVHLQNEFGPLDGGTLCSVSVAPATTPKSQSNGGNKVCVAFSVLTINSSDNMAATAAFWRYKLTVSEQTTSFSFWFCKINRGKTTTRCRSFTPGWSQTNLPAAAITFKNKCFSPAADPQLVENPAELRQ